MTYQPTLTATTDNTPPKTEKNKQNHIKEYNGNKNH